MSRTVPQHKNAKSTFKDWCKTKVKNFYKDKAAGKHVKDKVSPEEIYLAGWRGGWKARKWEERNRRASGDRIMYIKQDPGMYRPGGVGETKTQTFEFPDHRVVPTKPAVFDGTDDAYVYSILSRKAHLARHLSHLSKATDEAIGGAHGESVLNGNVQAAAAEKLAATYKPSLDNQDHMDLLHAQRALRAGAWVMFGPDPLSLSDVEGAIRRYMWSPSPDIQALAARTRELHSIARRTNLPPAKIHDYVQRGIRICDTPVWTEVEMTARLGPDPLYAGRLANEEPRAPVIKRGGNHTESRQDAKVSAFKTMYGSESYRDPIVEFFRRIIRTTRRE